MRYKIVIFQIQTSYLDLHPEIDSEGRLTTNIYHKGDDFKFPIVNFPFICCNIPAAPAYGVYIEVFATSRIYLSSFVTQIFRNGETSHGGDRKTFEVMTSTLPKRTLGSSVLVSSNPLSRKS
jgi:hypothetical protein